MKRLNFLMNVVWIILAGALLSCKNGQGGGVIEPDPVDTAVTDPTENPANNNELTYIFQSGTEGYSCFRIPAIIKTKKGTLLAFAEGRKNNCGDAGNIDMIVKRSEDNGKTWSNIITVWNDGGNTCGNPAPVVDQKTGKIFLLMTWNLGGDDIGEINDGSSKDTRRVFVTHSDDDGLTWASPKEITDKVKKKIWGWYATGPCHGIQISQGKYAGRLVIPCDYIEIGTGHGSSHVIYSDDHGETWHLGGSVPANKVNESTVAELSDGTLMLNMRSSSHYRMVATSNDGGLIWSDAKADPQLPGPVCQGSLLSYTKNNKATLFFSNPANPSKRINMTIKMSLDDGNSWPHSYQVYEGPSAYSDLVMITNDQIGILYEAGKSSPYTGIAFKKIPVNKIQ